MFARLRGLALKNTGSVARDHLASERTFLSWLRTGLGFIALGIAMERFSQLDISALQPSIPNRPLSGTQNTHEDTSRNPSLGRRDHTQDMVVGLMGTGSGSIAYGMLRYYSNMKLLDKGLFRPSFYGVGGLGVTVLGLTGLAGWTLIRDKQRDEQR